MDLKAGINGASENRVETSRVERSGEDGDYSSTASEKLGEVDHGDHVTLCHEREEKKVRCCVGVRSHGRDVCGRRRYFHYNVFGKQFIRAIGKRVSNISLYFQASLNNQL